MPGVKEAQKVQKAIMKGTGARSYRVRTNVHFHRPRTETQRKAPAYARSPLSKLDWKNPANVLRYPVKTDANMTQIENSNTIVFVVDLRANKPMIKKAFSEVFNVKVARVNTLITPRGEKKAFIKLSADTPAVDVASKIGLA